MKKVFLIAPVLSLIFFSCNTARLIPNGDDVYNSPSDERRLAKIAAEEQAKKDALEKQKLEEEKLAQKAKDDANPYYKDPQYSKDDYYDYKYASQIKRFNNPISGAGYYDNYYTNTYNYNQNPAMYGTSIYSSYNYLMPSNQFNNYSNGLSFGLGTGYYSGYNSYGYGSCYSCGYNSFGYNPYGYNSFGYNPYGYSSFGYSPYGYSPFGYGYGYSPYGYSPYGYSPYGYGSYGYGGGYGYYNSFDVNSAYSGMVYGPRGSHGGGSDARTLTPGMKVLPEMENSVRRQFIQSVQAHQESTPRFTEVVRHTNPTAASGNINGTNLNSTGSSYASPSGNPVSNSPRGSYNSSNINNGGNVTNTNSSPRKNVGFWSGILGGNSQPVTNENTVRTEGPRASQRNESQVIQNPANSSPRQTRPIENNNSGWNSWPSNSGSNGASGGGSFQRGGGGGGGGGARRR